MLISVLGFGSIWTRRLPMEARVQERFDQQPTAADPAQPDLVTLEAEFTR